MNNKKVEYNIVLHSLVKNRSLEYRSDRSVKVGERSLVGIALSCPWGAWGNYHSLSTVLQVGG